MSKSKLLFKCLKTIQQKSQKNLSVGMLTEKHKGNFQITSSVCSSKDITCQRYWTSLANKELHIKKKLK